MVVAMDKHQSEQKPTNSSTKSSAECNKVILDHFWMLADKNEAKRCRSVQVILQTLSDQINRNYEKLDIKYCFDRVIRGLTSTRAFARHGFCVLFSALLSEFPTHYSMNELFELARKEFGSKITPDTPSENTIAWALFLASVSKSGRILDCEKELLKEIFDQCLILGAKKDFVEIIASDIIKNLIDSPPQEDFESSYLDVFKNVDDSRKNSLFYTYSILLINERFPNIKDDYVKNYIATNVYKKASKKFDKIVVICKESTKSYPHIHPIIRVLIQTIFRIETEHFDQFCSTIIEKLLSANFEKILLAFEIIKVLLEYIHCDQISKLFSPTFIELFIKALAWKDNPNHLKAIELGDYIVQFTGKIQDKPDVQVEIAKCFVEKPGGVHFDELSRSKVLQSVLKNFDDNASKSWALYLQNLFLNEDNIPSSDFTRIRAFQQMITVTKQYKKMDDFILEMLRFLFCHAYIDFQATKKIQFKNGKKVENFKVPPSEKLSGLFAESFRSVLSNSSQLGIDKTDSKKVKLEKRNTVLQTILESINEIVSDKKIKFKGNFDNEKVLKNIERIQTKIQRITALKESSIQQDTFKFLYLNFAFELFHNTDEIDLILNDFDECVERCLFVKSKNNKKKTPKKKAGGDDGGVDGEEPQWADVLTDLFLSLLSKNSKHMKSVVLLSFRQIAPFVTKAGIDAICDAFMGRAVEGESDDEEDDEEEEEEGDVEMKDADKGEDENDEDDNDDEDDDDDEEDMEMDDDEEVDPEFKKRLIQALGDAAEVSDEDNDDEKTQPSKKAKKAKATNSKEADDDEDDDDDAMDDEAMFRIDDALAEVFRSKFGDKKKNQSEREQMLNFRSRAIELIQMVIENKEDLDINIVLGLLLNLISLTRSTYSVKNMSVLANKCGIVFDSLHKRKNFLNLEQYNEEIFHDVVKALISFQYKCSDKQLNQKLVQLTAWLLGTMKDNIKNTSTNKKLNEAFEQTLKDYFAKSLETDKNLFVRAVPIINQIDNVTFLKSSFYKILIENSFSKDYRPYRRGRALEVLSMILSNLRNSYNDNNCYQDLAKASIKQLNDDLDDSISKKGSKISGLYLNGLFISILNTNIFADSNADKLKALKDELKVLLPKFEKLPRETRKRLDKGFIKKVKNATE